MQHYSNATLKKCVFRATLKSPRLSHFRKFSGSAFQILGADTGNARSPTVFRWATFSFRSFWPAERRDRAGAYKVSIEVKYCGASPCKHLKVTILILYLMRNTIGSQCNCLRRGVTCSYFFLLVTIRAALFWISCSFPMR